ncbi:MAG: outer membrane lipoprotein-sorting protein [Acidobacteria bacterium]|nr:outer membrane lipoprotein-sorting protein [Acidobacteriota bacterium]
MPFGCESKTARSQLLRFALPAAVWMGAVWMAWSLASFAPARASGPRPPSANESSTNGGKLARVLASMDRAAANFSSMAGHLDYTKVTVIVDDHSTESGEIFFEKSKGQTRVMIAFREPAEKYALFADGKVSLYRPKIAQVQEYQLANRQDLMEQFLLLGFGTGGEEMQEAYHISYLGEEMLDGQQAYRLELLPKSAKVSVQLDRIELWISPESWQPLQQKFFEPSGDYLIARYTAVTVNGKLPEKTFRLPIQGKVQIIRPQNPA